MPKGFAVGVGIVVSYPTERTRPVSARLASSDTPRMRCSRMEETSVGDAFASEAYVLADLDAALLIAGMAERVCL